jgi:hypothetical protein
MSAIGKRVRVGEAADKPVAPIVQLVKPVDEIPKKQSTPPPGYPGIVYKENPKKQPMSFKDPYYDEIVKQYMNLVHEAIVNERYFFKPKPEEDYSLFYDLVETSFLEFLSNMSGLKSVPVAIKSIIYGSNYTIVGLISLLHGLTIRSYIKYGPYFGGFVSAVLMVVITQLFIHAFNFIIRMLLFSYNMFTYNPLLN